MLNSGYSLKLLELAYKGQCICKSKYAYFRCSNCSAFSIYMEYKELEEKCNGIYRLEVECIECKMVQDISRHIPNELHSTVTVFDVLSVYIREYVDTKLIDRIFNFTKSYQIY